MKEAIPTWPELSHAIDVFQHPDSADASDMNLAFNVAIESMRELMKSSTTERMVCNICGKPLDVFDLQEKISYHSHMGYGSRFDEEIVDLDLCCDCFDKMMLEYIIPRCKYIPVTHTTKEDAAKILAKIQDDIKRGGANEPV